MASNASTTFEEREMFTYECKIANFFLYRGDFFLRKVNNKSDMIYLLMLTNVSSILNA